jgi:hypothetical protein
VFCPNWGTQNPDTAQTCSKCSFHLKGAAAPKFKGTMLMMNQPVVPTGGPAPAAGNPAAPAGGPPRPSASGAPPGAANVPSKLKGTMVGVAPMGGGMPAMGAPKTPPPPAATAESNSAFSPPVPQPGVNPLGGTVAADAGSFASAFGPPGPSPGGYAPPPQQPQQPYGAPPPQGPGAFAPTAAQPAAGSFGGPPPGYGQQQPPGQGMPGTQAQPAYGAPPPNAFGGGAPPGTPYGAPSPQPGYGPPPPQPGFGPPPGYGQQPGYGGAPPGYGGPPPGYGQQHPPAQQGYGAAPGGYGQAMQQAGAPAGYGQAGAIVGTLSSAGTKGPTRRNALMTLLLPFGVLVGGSILSTILAMLIPSLYFIGSLVSLGGLVWFVLLTIPMVNELKSVTQNANLAWWPIVVPFYSMYWAWLIIPAEVAKAKQILGVQQPPRPLVLYIFLWPFALASDLNDMVR